MKQSFFRVIFPILLLCPWATAQQNSRVIFLVRNAEAPAAGNALDPAGQQRALCLLQTLKDAGITQIYVNESQRTQQTAEPLAKALKLTPSVVPSLQVATFVRNLLYGGAGNALVVGDKDSLATIIARLHAGNIKAIAENEYNRMFLVTVTEGAATPVATLRYCDCGAPPAPAPPAPKPGPAKPPVKKAPAKKS
jgi:phosphohistidine phosphatase SixA